MYFLSCYIKLLGFKMVLLGEGVDEFFGGYLYFYKASNSVEFYVECRRKIMWLY